MQKFELDKIHKLYFIDNGICGELYKKDGIKYYSVTCSFESIDKHIYHKYDNIYLLLTEKELNKLFNESFYYDQNNNKIHFEQEDSKK